MSEQTPKFASTEHPFEFANSINNCNEKSNATALSFYPKHPVAPAIALEFTVKQ